MKDDDDISAFGSQAVDPRVLCTTNDYRDDGWVFIKGNLPFHIDDVIHATLGQDGEVLAAIYVDCDYNDSEEILIDDEEKLKIFERVQTVHLQRERAEAEDPQEFDTLDDLMEFLMRRRMGESENPFDE